MATVSFGKQVEWTFASQLSPTLRVVAMIIAALLVGAALYQRGITLPRALTLFLLRAIAVTGALVLCLQPVRVERGGRYAPSHVAVLVDDSVSMRLGDRSVLETRGKAAADWLTKFSGQAPNPTRVLDYYTFDRDLLPTNRAEALRKLQTPSGRATHIREALDALKTRYDPRDLGGVIVVSDGADNGLFGEQEKLDGEATAFVASIGAPISSVWAGTRGLADIALSRVAATDFAFVRTAVTFDVQVRVSGDTFADRALDVVLERDGERVASETITVERGKTIYPVHFSFAPDRVGKYIYSLSVAPQPEETIVENNRRLFVLNVVRDKIRALHVAGAPSFDVRFVRGLLKNNPNVDLISFFILRTPRSTSFVSQDEMSLIPFPTDELFREQLRSFDVIFLHDFNFDPYGIRPYLGDIASYVQDGGGIAMIGGENSFGLGGYFGTPVDDILPVESGPGPTNQLWDDGAYRPTLTDDGRIHPVTSLLGDVHENEKRWQNIVELAGVNWVSRLRPDAVSLLNHPRLHLADGSPLPFLAVREVGKGRSLSLATDAFWRVGFGESQQSGRADLFDQFWDRAMRWLIRDPELSNLRAEPKRSMFDTADNVEVSVRLLSGAPKTAVLGKVRVESVDKSLPSNVEQPFSLNDTAPSTLNFGPLPQGGYRLHAEASLGGRTIETQQVFVVAQNGPELERPEADDRLLTLLAHATHGMFRAASDRVPSLDEIPLKPPRFVAEGDIVRKEVWASGWIFALTIASLAAYWTLRRRWGQA